MPAGRSRHAHTIGEISSRTVSGVTEATALRFRARGVSLLTDAVTRALVRAAASGEAVRVITRGDASRGIASRIIEGVPVNFGPTREGRERVRIAVTDDAEQVLLIDRIAVVLPLFPGGSAPGEAS